jgi:hypothetical protein
MSDIPFGTTDWSQVERTEHRGERGLAYWRTKSFGGIRVRIVGYTPGYRADLAHDCADKYAPTHKPAPTRYSSQVVETAYG